MLLYLGKIAKTIGWLIASLLLLTIIAYALLLFIKRHDSAPSAAFLNLTRAPRANPVPPDADNGYVTPMGFSAPAGQDAFAEGVKNIADLNVWIKKGDYLFYEKKAGAPVIEAIGRQPEILSEILSLCDGTGQECIPKLFINHRAISQLTQENPWILDRYKDLIRKPSWRERNAYTVMSYFPRYSDITESQKIFLLQAWIQAFTGNSESARQAIEMDHVFWRNVIAETDSLTTKMIAATALRRNYVLGALALVAEPWGKPKSGMPISWQRELSDDDRLLSIVYSGELRLSQDIFQKIGDGRNLFNDSGEFPWLSRLSGRLTKPLLKQQDMLNMYAGSYLDNEQKFAVPLDQFPVLLRSHHQAEGKTRWSLYNPVGQILLRMGSETDIYSNFYVRLADLEVARRLALLTVTIHQQHIPAEKLPSVLSSSPIRNPYNNEAFQWDKDNGFLFFQGLQEGKDRARFEFFYRP